MPMGGSSPTCRPGSRGSSADARDLVRRGSRRRRVGRVRFRASGRAADQAFRCARPDHRVRHSGRSWVAGPMFERPRRALCARPCGWSASRCRRRHVEAGDAGVRHIRARAGRLSQTRPRVRAIRPSEMERPPSRVFLADKTEGLGGRVTAGNSPARAGREEPSAHSPGAASSQPPHKSISHSKSRTTSSPVYERRYPRTPEATTELRPIQRSAIADDRGVDEFCELRRQRAWLQWRPVEGVHPGR